MQHTFRLSDSIYRSSKLKKEKMEKLPLFSALALLLLASCRKDTNQITILEEGYAPPRIYVEASLSGKVRDRTGQPLGNVAVEVSGEVATTNEEGYFQFIV